MAISLRVVFHISSTCVSLIRSFHASAKLHASHPSLKTTIQHKPQTIERSLYFSALSKVFERLVLKQLVHYIDEQSLLLPSVSGFRKEKSTTTVLLGIQDDLIRAMNRGEVTMMAMADYSKAFDTVRFKSVLTKMHVTGFSKSFLKWMLSYLPERRQFFQIDARRSDLEVVGFGVPQGSLLGLFILHLYVADHQEHIQCPCFQYADDTTFYLHSKVSKLDDFTTGML